MLHCSSRADYQDRDHVPSELKALLSVSDLNDALIKESGLNSHVNREVFLNHIIHYVVSIAEPDGKPNHLCQKQRF